MRPTPWLILLAFTVVGLQASGQSCGRTDTVTFDPQSTGTYQIDITDFINNDLSNPSQGVCGVELTFAHQFIYDVSITLSSPGGQSVELVGPISGQPRPPTIFTRWFIDFTTCTNTAEPDPGFPAQWNNNSPFNWLVGSTYDGTYYPSDGCLEDFDTGPVNGIWTFTLTSDRPGAGGAIVYARLIFCDEAGLDCCFADAGTLTDPPVLLCVGNPGLDLAPDPFYPVPRPDENEYGYTYLLFEQAGLLAQVDSLADWTDLPPGNYDMCGLSYLRADSMLVPQPNGIINRSDIQVDLEGFFPSFCGDLSDDCQEISILPIPDTTFLDRTVCIGGSVILSGQIFDETGVYDLDLIGQGQCDSIVQLDLQVVDEFNTTQDTIICAGESFDVGSSSYNLSGVYIDTLISTLGCDSIVTTDLTVRDPLITDTTVVLCAGESIFIGSEAFTSTDPNIVRTLISPSTGCDSVIFLDLTVLDPQIVVSPYDPIDCINEGITLDASSSLTTQAPGYMWFDGQDSLLGTSPTLAVSAAGNYILELSEAQGGVSCSVRDTFFVEDLRDQPVAAIDVADTLTCGETSVVLGGAATSNEPSIIYDWTGPADAVFLSPTDRRFVEVGTPGMYQLVVVNSLNGCRDSAQITVFQDTLSPDASILGVGQLNCFVPTRELSADTSQTNSSELNYSWAIDCQGLFSGPTVIADCPAIYSLTVTNSRTECASQMIVQIDEDFNPPQADIRPAEVLTCDLPQQFLDGSESLGDHGLSFIWTSAGGPLPGQNDSLLIDQGGQYQLLVQDTVNGCVDSTQINVAVDQDFPQADSGPDTTVLNCYQPTLLLGGLNTSIGPDFSYSWVTFAEQGDTLSTSGSLLIQPPGGLYIFAVEDDSNGCVTRDTSRVNLELDTPFIRIDPPLEFGCFTDFVTLDVSSTNLNYEYIIDWNGPCIPLDEDTTAIAVFCPGEYEVRILNVDNGCPASIEVEVELAPNAIVAVLPDTAQIDCSTGFAVIDNSLSTPATVTEWLRDGQPVSLFPNNPQVTVPGTYTYIITNFDGSCSDTAQIEVVVDCPILPIIVPYDSLTCNVGQIILDASFSLPADGPGVTVEWLFDNPVCVQPQADPRQLGVACPGTYGFVISDAVFGLSDTIFMEVVQDVRPPDVEAGLPDTLNCNQPVVTLDASGGEIDPRYQYTWAIGIDTVGQGVTVDVTEPSVYLLQVLNLETGCEAADIVPVFQDIDVPELSFGEVQIPCREDSFALAVIAEPAGNYGYSWNGPLIQAGQQQDTVLAGQAGTYLATVTNLDNGCPTSASVDLVQLPCPPCLLLSDSVLTCIDNEVELALDFCEPCLGCSFSWSLNGVELVGENDVSIIASEAGEYSVRVVNQAALSSSISASVVDLRVLPESAAGPDRFLTCDSSSVLLGSTVIDTIFGFQYQWLREDDSPIPGADGTFVRADEAGIYQLVVTNPVSQCEAIDTVILAYDTLPPMVTAGPERRLTCDDPLQVLDGVGSSTGTVFEYTWSGGPAETCLEGIETLSPIVACGGTYYLEVEDLRNGCTAIDSVVITADDNLPVIIPLPDTNLTCADTEIELVPFIDDPTLETSWCPLDEFGLPVDAQCVSTPTTIVNSPGDYRFELFNANTGCRNGFNVTVGEDLIEPNVFVGQSDTLFCTLDSLALPGGGSTDSGLPPVFSWTSNEGFPIAGSDQDTAFAFAPDQYYLTVTDPRNGCTAVDTIDLFRDLEAPTAFAGPDTTLNCRRRQVRLLGSGGSLSGQVSFEWTTVDGQIISGEDRLDPLVGAAGNYVLGVTDLINNCTAFDVLTVAEDTLRPAAQIAFQDSLLINCYTPQLVVDATTSGSPNSNPLNYSWRTIGLGTPLNGQTSETVTIDEAGSYQLLVEDAVNGCRDTLPFNVAANFSTAQLNLVEPELITCAITSVELSTTADAASPYAYVWRNQAGDTLSQLPTATANASGNYELIVTDTISGCPRTLLTAVLDDLVAPVVELSSPPVLSCERVFSPINANGSDRGGNYVPSWSAPPGGSFEPRDDPYLIAASEPGFYYFELLDTDNGCSTIDSAQVGLVARAITSLDFELEQAACVEDEFGGLFVLGQTGGTPPFRYRVDGGLLTDRLVYGNLPPGEHTLTVIDSSGCERTETFLLDQAPEILVELGPDTTIRQGETILLDFQTTALSIDTLIWTSDGPIPTPGQAPMLVRPPTDYVYQLTVIDTNGCAAIDLIRIAVINDIALFMPTAFSPNGDNQNDRFFPFAGPQVERVLTFRIFDRWGSLVHEQLDIPANDPTYGWDGTLDGRIMNAAVFVWQVELQLADGTREWVYGDVVLVR
ncbi:MAG: T9SS type B sorting domain-containing protein [Bacteroidota bacterium]